MESAASSDRARHAELLPVGDRRHRAGRVGQGFGRLRQEGAGGHPRRFRVGTQTLTNVLLAIQTLTSSESTYSQARHQFILNKLLLEQTAGTASVKNMEADQQLAGISGQTWRGEKAGHSPAFLRDGDAVTPAAAYRSSGDALYRSALALENLLRRLAHPVSPGLVSSRLQHRWTSCSIPSTARRHPAGSGLRVISSKFRV